MLANIPKTSKALNNQPTQHDRLSRTILNSLTAHVAILDENGFILETNRAWKQFAEQNQIKIRPDTLEVNYLEICDNAANLNLEEPNPAAQGIRNVISGLSDEFVMEYPCHSPDEKRWFYMRVTRAAGPGPLRIVVSHENITAIKLAEQLVLASEKALRQEKQKLEEANTALKVVLHQIEQDKQNLETDIHNNMRRLVLPLVNQLASQALPGREKRLIATLKLRLTELTKPYIRHLSTINSMLTPQELEIAFLIRDGFTSKEIADQLNLSITTISFHRRNLRRKLDLRNTGTNLRSFLMTLDE